MKFDLNALFETNMLAGLLVCVMILLATLSLMHYALLFGKAALSAFRVAVRGWPPPYLDADGDANPHVTTVFSQHGATPIFNPKAPPPPPPPAAETANDLHGKDTNPGV